MLQNCKGTRDKGRHESVGRYTSSAKVCKRDTSVSTSQPAFAESNRCYSCSVCFPRHFKYSQIGRYRESRRLHPPSPPRGCLFLSRARCPLKWAFVPFFGGGFDFLLLMYMSNKGIHTYPTVFGVFQPYRSGIMLSM